MAFTKMIMGIFSQIFMRTQVALGGGKNMGRAVWSKKKEISKVLKKVTASTTLKRSIRVSFNLMLI